VISFRLFGIPVAVRPSFLVIAALLGLASRRLDLVIAWVGVLFVSILVHELGHALTARAFGAAVEIELNGIGGLTSWSAAEEEFGPGRRATVAAAGSAVGVLFGGLVWLTQSLTGPFFGIADFVVANLIGVNVFWGLFNWLPIRPLDGGHLLVSLLQKVSPARADRIANVVFLITAVAALAVALWLQRIFIVVLAGWLVMGELTRGRPIRPATTIPPMSFDAPDPGPDQAEPDRAGTDRDPEPPGTEHGGHEQVEPEPKPADG